jgi:hypothetical protein
MILVIELLLKILFMFFVMFGLGWLVEKIANRL